MSRLWEGDYRQELVDEWWALQTAPPWAQERGQTEHKYGWRVCRCFHLGPLSSPPILNQPSIPWRVLHAHHFHPHSHTAAVTQATRSPQSLIIRVTQSLFPSVHITIYYCSHFVANALHSALRAVPPHILCKISNLSTVFPPVRWPLCAVGEKTHTCSTYALHLRLSSCCLTAILWDLQVPGKVSLLFTSGDKTFTSFMSPLHQLTWLFGCQDSVNGAPSTQLPLSPLGLLYHLNPPVN